MKRIVAAVLWTYSCWYIGSMVALFLGISDVLGPVLGAGAGALVALDPRQMFWRTKGVAAS